MIFRRKLTEFTAEQTLALIFKCNRVKKHIDQDWQENIPLYACLEDLSRKITVSQFLPQKDQKPCRLHP